jgi:benzoyl-CoA reductase subunit C
MLQSDILSPVGIVHELKRRTGKKAIGYFCLQTPVEIIEAADMIPVRIVGDNSDITEADSLLPAYICSFARNSLDLGLKNRYDCLDGIVVPHACDTIKSIYGIWKNNISIEFAHFIRYPIAFDKRQAKDLLVYEFSNLRESLANYGGKKIDDSDLKKSIQTANESRSAYQDLSKMRGLQSLSLKTSFLMYLASRSFYQLRSDFMQELKIMTSEIDSCFYSNDDSPKIILIGGPIGDLEIVKAIEDAGANIVADDLCTGSRAFKGRVDTGADPIEALVDYHLNNIYCACKAPYKRRLEELDRMIRDRKIDGAILLVQKFCDPQLWDYPALKDFFEMRNLPFQMIECEYRLGSDAGLRNRVQAFIEMIRGGI